MRDILVHASGFQPWPANVRYAFEIASLLEANLCGVYASHLGTLVPDINGSPEIGEIIAMARELRDEALGMEESFVALGNRAGSKKINWQVAEGYLNDVIAYASSWHDLLIVERNDDVPSGTASNVGDTVLKTELPCLIVPSSHKNPASLACVAIAWNGSQQALRAIHAAMPLLRRAKRIVVFHGQQRDRYMAVEWTPEFSLPAYFYRHGLNTEDHDLTGVDEENMGDELLEIATSIGADIFIMGAYGRSRFSERIFGGVTRRVLDLCPIPVFMKH